MSRNKTQIPGITVPIDGKQTRLQVQEIDITKLAFDSDNPRIGFFRDAQPRDYLTDDEVRFALTSRSPAAFDKLKESIHNNKGILHPIWIEPLGMDKYRVIEGNTRLLIYQNLCTDEPNESQWKKIICYVLPAGVNDDEKNFIRLQAHLRGTNEWDAYEKAKYLYKLSHDNHWPITKIDKQTKLGKREIEQNIEAFTTMQGQYIPTHQEPNEVAKFSYFVEYVKDKKLQRAMEKHGYGVKDFCDWVGDSKMLPTGQDVRRLRDILDDGDAAELFKTKGFSASMGVLALRRPGITDPFYRDIERVIEGLQSMRADEIDEVAIEQASNRKAKIAELAKWSARILKMINDN